MKLLGNKIIATPQDESEVTKSGLFIPGHVNKTGDAIPVIVLFVGHKFECKDIIKKGDVVFVSKRFGDPANLRDYPYARTYNGEDILAYKV